MPSVTDPPPVPLDAKLLEVRTALDAAIPAKQLDRNLLVATWNLRAFGDVTDKWRAEEGDVPRRDLFDVRCIAEIVSRFDVVGIQEIRGNLTALQTLVAALGPNWATIMTDVTRGKAGNNERMAFVFDVRRVKPSGLAGELVVAIETADDGRPEDPRPAVREDAVRGQLRGRGDAADARDAARPLRQRASESRGARGDRALARGLGEARGLLEPEPDRARRLQHRPTRRSALRRLHVDRDPSGPGPQRRAADDLRRPAEAKFYDQIAWFVEKGKGPVLTLTSTAAGSFDFVPILIGDLDKTALSWKISDHYPLWTEFSVR